MKKIVTTDNAPQAIGPYSQAVSIGVGTILFCSGQIPIDPATGEMKGESASEQAQQVIENLKAVIEAAGLTMNDVVKTTIYLVNLGAFQEVNAVYERFFSDFFPARATIQVAALPRGALVEIDAILCR